MRARSLLARSCCRRSVLCLSLVLSAACAPTPQRTALPTVWHPSPNFDERRPQFIVLHYTGGATLDRALAALTTRSREVSAHYLIDVDGQILQLVDERARAWHAGRSKWGSVEDLNSLSIGIELVNDGASLFPEAQVTVLIDLLHDLTRRLRIPPANVLGHADIAPRRKRDPGSMFPWSRLAEAGFGLWCDSPPPGPPPDFDPLNGLRLLGYDVSDPRAAISAFKTRFLPQDTGGQVDSRAAGMIYCLVGLGGRLP